MIYHYLVRAGCPHPALLQKENCSGKACFVLNGMSSKLDRYNLVEQARPLHFNLSEPGQAEA
jgi:hypothetical protein